MIAKKKPEDDDAGQTEAQALKDTEDDLGFRGTKVDPTPNKHYSVGGVLAGLPTPETDHDSHVAAHERISPSRLPSKEGGTA